MTILVYTLLMAFTATVPVWNYSVAWGDHPSELIGMVLIVVLFIILFGKDVLG